MVTITDIAQRLGVAVSTVSKGLNNANDISETTKAMILHTAVEMGYASRRVQKSGLRKMCIFAEEESFQCEDQFGYDLAMGFRVAAAQNGWQVSTASYRLILDSQDPVDTYMLRHDFAGAFFIRRHFSPDCLKPLTNTAFPSVLFEGEVDNPLVGSVGNDHGRGILMAVEHLYRLGHRRIAMFNSGREYSITRHRETAYRAALDAFRLEFDKSLLVYYGGEGSIRPAIGQLLENGATAVLCAGNCISTSVMSQLLELGRRVPEEISILGFDDCPRARIRNYPLTTIRQDNFALGKAAFYMLEGLRNKIPIQNLLLRPNLVVQESTAPCGKPA